MTNSFSSFPTFYNKGVVTKICVLSILLSCAELYRTADRSDLHCVDGHRGSRASLHLPHGRRERDPRLRGPEGSHPWRFVMHPDVPRHKKCPAAKRLPPGNSVTHYVTPDFKNYYFAAGTAGIAGFDSFFLQLLSASELTASTRTIRQTIFFILSLSFSQPRVMHTGFTLPLTRTIMVHSEMRCNYFLHLKSTRSRRAAVRPLTLSFSPR